MLTAQRLQPAGSLRGPVEIEPAGVEQRRHRNLPEFAVYDAGMGIEGPQHALQLMQLRRAEQIRFVQHQQITELDLIHQQIHHRALILRTQRLAARLQIVHRTVVAQEVKAIHHSDHTVQSGIGGEAFTLFILKRKGFRHGQRLRNTGGFNHQMVKTSRLSQPFYLYQQIFTQRAADAAVAHFNQFFIGARQLRTAVTHQGRVNIHFRHIIDDDRDAASFPVVENMVKQGGFTGTEKAGENRNGETRIF